MQQLPFLTPLLLGLLDLFTDLNINHSTHRQSMKLRTRKYLNRLDKCIIACIDEKWQQLNLTLSNFSLSSSMRSFNLFSMFGSLAKLSVYFINHMDKVFAVCPMYR